MEVQAESGPVPRQNSVRIGKRQVLTVKPGVASDLDRGRAKTGDA
jgi:hypothetical protein